MSRFASPSRAAGLLLVILLAACLSVPTESASSRPAPAGPSYLFLSPNRDVDLSLPEVSRRLASPAHRQFHRLAGKILQELGVRGAEVHDAVGDWSDGVENSLLVVLPDAAPADALRCAAACFGLAADQKAVLAFHADPAGRDVLTVLDLPGRDLAAVRPPARPARRPRTHDPRLFQRQSRRGAGRERPAGRAAAECGDVRGRPAARSRRPGRAPGRRNASPGATALSRGHPPPIASHVRR